MASWNFRPAETGAAIIASLHRRPMIVSEISEALGRRREQTVGLMVWLRAFHDKGLIYIHDWRVWRGRAFPVFGWCGPGKEVEDAPAPNVRKVLHPWPPTTPPGDSTL